MNNKSTRVFLEHILESIDLILDYTEEEDLESFLQSRPLQDAVIRRFEIIGEAVKNLPGNFRREHDQIEWKKIAGMRDVLIHKYFGVELKITWRVVENRLPKLKKQIEKILKDCI